MRKIGILLCCSALLCSSAFAEAKKKKSTTTSPSTSSHQTTRKKPLVQTADENMSGQGYGMAGCGLGSLAFGEQKGMIQIVAATLNATGYQTFGISTGTSNCKPGLYGEKAAALFITVNKEALAKDISRGSGESLSSLSEIVGCSDSKAFGGKLQKNFGEIFPKADASAEDATKKIIRIIHDDNELSKNCVKLS